MPFDLDKARRQLATDFPMVNDHPDIAGLLRDAETLNLLAQAIAAPFLDQSIDIVVAPEARGPIVGALAARELGCGLVLARKADRNHPGADIPVHSAPTWRGHSETFLGRSFDINPHDRVLLVDDWITTGNTLRAARSIVAVLGGDLVGTAVIMNKAEPATIDELNVHFLVDFEQVASGVDTRRPATA